ncbi:MAG TPA: hypothetical protein VIF09_00360, partial [Polyangiaceae bacterium]
MPDPADATKPLSELSEGQLLAEIQRVREWLAQHRPSEPGYDKIVIYRDWLEIERIRRHLTGRLTSAFGGEAVGARFIVQGFEPVARGLFWKKGSIVAGAGVVGGAAERFYGGSIPKGETFVDLNTKYPKYQKNFP